jgi:hypothetical protein
MTGVSTTIGRRSVVAPAEPGLRFDPVAAGA